ncbi:Olfactomedin, partial [Nibea albiflora]
LNLCFLRMCLQADGQTQKVQGQKKNSSCACAVDPNLWSFPAVKYEAVLQKVESCEVSLDTMMEQVNLSSQRLPEMQALVDNLTARLEPHQYLHDRGLYTSLSLRQMVEELSELDTNVGAIHSQQNNAQTRTLTKETIKEKLRYLKNRAESCKSIPKPYRGRDRHCLKGLITSISDPVVTKISSYGKSYTSGSWGQQAQMDSEGQKNSYWVQPLVNNQISGNTLRVYQTYEDFMASAKYEDFTIASSHTHANSIEGPSAVLYGEALYYHCYNTPDVCRYDLKTNAVKRVTLPGTGVGFHNKFQYCYYECRPYSDVDVEADERGLWAIYATVGNHGNIVVSRLDWNAVN